MDALTGIPPSGLAAVSPCLPLAHCAGSQSSSRRGANQEQQIALEVRNAVRAVQTNYERVQAYRLARELAAGKLEAEEKKLQVGLSTNFIVLQYQRDLADARTAELLASIDYNLSLADLERVQGTTLKSRNIRLEDLTQAR